MNFCFPYKNKMVLTQLIVSTKYRDNWIDWSAAVSHGLIVVHLEEGTHSLHKSSEGKQLH